MGGIEATTTDEDPFVGRFYVKIDVEEFYPDN